MRLHRTANPVRQVLNTGRAEVVGGQGLRRIQAGEMARLRAFVQGVVMLGKQFMDQRPRVRQLLTQVSEFIRGGLKKCHYSKVSCSGSRGFVRFKAAKTWACSVLVVDSPALGWEPFRVMR